MSSNYYRNRHDDPLNFARGFRNGLAIIFGGMILAGIMWAALSAANSAYQVRAVAHQEAFSSFRSAGVGR